MESSSETPGPVSPAKISTEFMAIKRTLFSQKLLASEISQRSSKINTKTGFYSSSMFTDTRRVRIRSSSAPSTQCSMQNTRNADYCRKSTQTLLRFFGTTPVSSDCPRSSKKRVEDISTAIMLSVLTRSKLQCTAILTLSSERMKLSIRPLWKNLVSL